MQRAEDLMWVLDSLPAVESDLSAFHGIRNPYELSSAKFFELASMLPFYPGAVQRIFQIELAKEQAPATLVSAPNRAADDVTTADYDGKSFGSLTSDPTSPLDYTA